MAKVRVSINSVLMDGMTVKFKAPCNCSDVDGMKVTYITRDDSGYSEHNVNFTFRDAAGNDLTNIGNLFATGSVVCAILDTEKKYAYLQNANTNGYLEKKFSKSYAKAYLESNFTFEGETHKLELTQANCVGDAFEVKNGCIRALRDCVVMASCQGNFTTGYAQYDLLAVYIYLNDDYICGASDRVVSSAAPYTRMCSTIVQPMSAGDTLSLRVSKTNGASGVIGSGENNTFLSVAAL